MRHFVTLRDYPQLRLTKREWLRFRDGERVLRPLEKFPGKNPFDKGKPVMFMAPASADILERRRVVGRMFWDKGRIVVEGSGAHVMKIVFRCAAALDAEVQDEDGRPLHRKSSKTAAAAVRRRPTPTPFARFERELREVRDWEDVNEIATGLANARVEGTYSLGIEYLGASSVFGVAGEVALLEGRGSGWGLLAAARRASALAFLLAPSVASSYRAALAMIEALQWGEIRTAQTIANLMIRGYRGDWHVKGRMVPSDWEIESLAFALLARVSPNKKRAVELSSVELAPLSEFAVAAGTVRASGSGLARGFERAFDAHSELCRDSGVVGRGARLTAAPVYACWACRSRAGMPLPEENSITHSLYAEPFRSFQSHVGHPIDKRVAKELRRGSAIAREAGHELD